MTTDAAPDLGRDPYAQALAEARALIARLKTEGRHHVAASLLTDRARYSAVSLETALPRGAICAEAVAVGMAAAAEPLAQIRFSVAVNRRGEVVPPCGFCRELLIDYGPEAVVCVAEVDGVLTLAPLRELMPHAYKAHLRLAP